MEPGVSGMSGRFIVVGLGNVGLRVLWDLTRHGHEVVGVDSSYEAVERARSMGLNAELGDVAAVSKLAGRIGRVDAVVSALPGAIGFNVVKSLVELGFSVVDVSFFPEDPWPLHELALSRGVTVVVDAGIAPGLSNFLVGAGVRRTGSRRVRIFVGGISARPDSNPLGLAATWSTEDLLEEYRRPARYIRDGRVHSVSPLEATPGQVEVPGVGVLEYFPTDGLRTLLKTYGDMEFMAEYTLRWPGHLNLMKTLASLGFLGDQNISVQGCVITPRACLASVLRSGLRGVRDIVVLMVELSNGEGTLRFRSVVKSDENWSAMSKGTGSFQAVVAELLHEGRLGRGLVVPEEIGRDPELASSVMRKLSLRSIHVLED